MDPNVKVIGDEQSVVSHIMAEIRDEQIQQDPLRFRTNLEKISWIMAYEISKNLPYSPKEVTTPLGTCEVDVLEDQPVIVSILRAGVPMHYGFLKIFDKAYNGFISAYRHHTRGNEFIVKVEYQACPPLEGRNLILVDPMIATGQSIVLSYDALVAEFGKPSQTFIASIIGSDQGIELVRRKIPDSHIYMAAKDKELTAKAYIVPGLGDAGDLAFGPKS